MPLKFSGYATWTTDWGGITERDTLQCNHCLATWFVKPGSGNVRGFCLVCMKPTCGAPACDACRPFEEYAGRLEP